MDLIWTMKINGEDRIVTGTIMSRDISVFDYESKMTLEKFENIKRQTFDYMVQKSVNNQTDDNDSPAKKTESDGAVASDVHKSPAETIMKSYG
jgi:hypothetical protein